MLGFITTIARRKINGKRVLSKKISGVNKYDWRNTVSETMVTTKVISGHPDKKCNLGKPITRAEFAIMVANFSNTKSISGAFTNTKESAQWY